VHGFSEGGTTGNRSRIDVMIGTTADTHSWIHFGMVGMASFHQNSSLIWLRLLNRGYALSLPSRDQILTVHHDKFGRFCCCTGCAFACFWFAFLLGASVMPVAQATEPFLAYPALVAHTGLADMIAAAPCMNHYVGDHDAFQAVGVVAVDLKVDAMYGRAVSARLNSAPSSKVARKDVAGKPRAPH